MVSTLLSLKPFRLYVKSTSEIPPLSAAELRFAKTTYPPADIRTSESTVKDSELPSVTVIPLRLISEEEAL